MEVLSINLSAGKLLENAVNLNPRLDQPIGDAPALIIILRYGFTIRPCQRDALGWCTIIRHHQAEAALRNRCALFILQFKDCLNCRSFQQRAELVGRPCLGDFRLHAPDAQVGHGKLILPAPAVRAAIGSDLIAVMVGHRLPAAGYNVHLSYLEAERIGCIADLTDDILILLALPFGQTGNKVLAQIDDSLPGHALSDPHSPAGQKPV